MDVTRENFREVYDHVQKTISDATFIAIDGEFSGVTNSMYNCTNYDSPEERYHKLKHNMSDFLLMQFGLSAFKWDPEKEEYIAEAFNFYIFPFRVNASGVPDRIFACQSSSIDFLSAQTFDFNKVFHHGIPYLRQSEEMSMRNTLNEKHIMRMQNMKSPRKSMDSVNGSATGIISPAGSPTVVSDPKTQAFLDGTKAKIEQFLQNSTENETLELEPCNSYLRKILYETVPTMFPEPLLLEPRVNDRTKQRYLAVSRAGSEEKMQRKSEEAKAKDESLLLDAVGFSRVIQLLSRCQKLIVGHNMLLDLLFTIQQFIRPLPATLDEFKALLNCTFPHIIDTKLMGSMLPFRESICSTALGDLHNRLAQHPFVVPKIIPPAKYDSSKSDQDMDLNLHEAAYDAHITGVSFLCMLNFLMSFKPQEVKSDTISIASSEIVSPYLNKVFLTRSPDVPYLNIAGSDLSPPRSHIFHLQFPTAWRAGDIRSLFSPVAAGINISWINDTQCFVALHDKTLAKQVKKVLIKPGGMESSPYVIRTYEEYQRDIAGNMNSIPVSKPVFNLTPYSKNKVWRPPSGISGSNICAPRSAQPTAATTSRFENNNATPKSISGSRKRSGEEVNAVKPSAARRISSTSNRINCLDLDEPEMKRHRSIDDQDAVMGKAQSVMQTDIPASTVDSADTEMQKSVPPKPSDFFQIPSWD